MAKAKEENLQFQTFIRNQITADTDITDEQILQNWKKHATGKTLTIKTIRRERTLFDKAVAHDPQKGLIAFNSSQAELLLNQYDNIEQLLGPAGSDWTWTGEHCESLLRDAIQRVLPASLRAGKGYVYGVRTTEKGVERSPEIDILIYDTAEFAPIFSIGTFVIVRAESVRAVIQVKRTLDASTLKKAVQNVVDAKRHVGCTCKVNNDHATRNLFSAVVSFEDSISTPKNSKISGSYQSVLQSHVSKVGDDKFLPDFVGSLQCRFLNFAPINDEVMDYEVISSVQNKENVALPVLLYMVVKKITRSAGNLLPGFARNQRVLDRVRLSVTDKNASIIPANEK